MAPASGPDAVVENTRVVEIQVSRPWSDVRTRDWRGGGASGHRGITALGTTPDHYAGIRTIVVPGTPRDGIYVLDALLDPQTSVRPQQIMTDTAG